MKIMIRINTEIVAATILKLNLKVRHKQISLIISN